MMLFTLGWSQWNIHSSVKLSPLALIKIVQPLLLPLRSFAVHFWWDYISLVKFWAFSNVCYSYFLKTFVAILTYTISARKWRLAGLYRQWMTAHQPLFNFMKASSSMMYFVAFKSSHSAQSNLLCLTLDLSYRIRALTSTSTFWCFYRKSVMSRTNSGKTKISRDPKVLRFPRLDTIIGTYTLNAYISYTHVPLKIC